MIDFTNELKKYKPCLEVQKAVDNNMDSDEIKDLMDILQAMSDKKDKGGA